eukprot:5009613-Amphidinium_carterae.1
MVKGRGKSCDVQHAHVALCSMVVPKRTRLQTKPALSAFWGTVDGGGGGGLSMGESQRRTHVLALSFQCTREALSHPQVYCGSVSGA